MSINDQRLTRRVEDLYASDAQFAAASPNEAITQAIDQPGVALPQLIRMVMEGYADRPALGQRALRFVTDPDSGRTMVELLPRFETITYRELWARAGTLATALSAEPAIRPGDRVCVLGFNSVDYTTIDIALIRLGAVSVPLQTSAPVTGLRPIVTETEPTMIATSIDNLGDAVEVLAGHAPARLVVFDYHGKVDTHREAVEAARARLAGSVTIDTLAELIERGRALPATPIADSADDALALLIYTSGSTGAPKGAMYRESQVMSFWRKSSGWFEPSGYPSITLNFMPMSHVGGRQVLYGTLSNGGTAYFVAKSDLSTLFEDLALVRPTELCFVPRIWDMVFAEFHSEVDRRLVDGADRAALEAQVKAELRENVLGGRFVMALTGSAPISAEMTAWVESLLADVHLVEGYGSTEAGMVLNDGMVRRPAVIDYKLVDVPELGYFGTDQPYPRGELLVKTQTMFPGYYQRPDVTAEVFDPDGFYRTGDIMAKVGPDQFVYLDRRNNVLKLSQGEFIAVSKLEAVFGDSPLVRQIFIYGNSARAYPLAVVVPSGDALSRHGIENLKPVISESLQEVARAAGLQSYEIPRDFIIETTPFTLENGLLTGIRKLARPQLKKFYGERLERLYTELADSQSNELRELRQSGPDAPVLPTLCRAAAALLGSTAADVRPDAHFAGIKRTAGSSVQTTSPRTPSTSSRCSSQAHTIPGASTTSWALRGFTGSTPCESSSTTCCGPKTRPVSKPGSRSSSPSRRDTTSNRSLSCSTPAGTRSPDRVGSGRQGLGCTTPGGCKVRVLNASMTAAMPARCTTTSRVCWANSATTIACWVGTCGMNPTIPRACIARWKGKTSSSASRSSSPKCSDGPARSIRFNR